MEEVNRRRRTVLQVQVGELHLWRLSQSSSPRKCRFHLGFSLVGIGGHERIDFVEFPVLRERETFRPGTLLQSDHSPADSARPPPTPRGLRQGPECNKMGDFVALPYYLRYKAVYKELVIASSGTHWE